MNILEFIKSDKKQALGIIALVILTIAIPVTVYLAQTQQIFKSRASSSPVIEAFEIKDSEGNIINCDGSTNPPTCNISTADIVIKIRDLNPLLK